jgi:hypothetical protein
MTHEGLQAELGAHLLRQPGYQHGREQGVPAQVEEAVLNPYPLNTEHLGEQLAECPLPGGGRRLEGFRPCGVVRDGEGTAVQFPDGG